MFLALGIVTAGATQAQAASRVTLGSNFAPMQGVLWGAFPNEDGGYQTLEPTLGRKLAVVHKYIPWTFAAWPQQIAPIINSGHIVLLSWSAAKTTTAASIAAGRQDAVIRSAATNMKALGGRILLRPFFEFDQPVGHPRYIGSAPQVVAAWKRTYSIFHSVGATNVRFVWSPMAFDFKRGVAQKFWPGSDFVDWVGPDGYNFPGSGFRDWDTIFGAAYAVCGRPGKADDDSRDGVARQRSSHARVDHRRWRVDPVAPEREVGQLLRLDQPEGLRLPVVTRNAKTLAAYRAWGRLPYFAPMS